MKEQKKQIKIMLAWTLAWVASLAFFLTFNNNFISGQNVKIDGADFI